MTFNVINVLEKVLCTRLTRRLQVIRQYRRKSYYTLRFISDDYVRLSFIFQEQNGQQINSTVDVNYFLHDAVWGTPPSHLNSFMMESIISKFNMRRWRCAQSTYPHLINASLSERLKSGWQQLPGLKIPKERVNPLSSYSWRWTINISKIPPSPPPIKRTLRPVSTLGRHFRLVY